MSIYKIQLVHLILKIIRNEPSGIRELPSLRDNYSIDAFMNKSIAKRHIKFKVNSLNGGQIYAAANQSFYSTSFTYSTAN